MQFSFSLKWSHCVLFVFWVGGRFFYFPAFAGVIVNRLKLFTCDGQKSIYEQVME